MKVLKPMNSTSAVSEAEYLGIIPDCRILNIMMTLINSNQAINISIEAPSFL